MADAELHRFRMPFPDDWRPATKEDAWALGRDLMFLGAAFATTDGRRVDPETVQVRDDVAYGGAVRLPDDLQPPEPPMRCHGCENEAKGGRDQTGIGVSHNFGPGCRVTPPWEAGK